MFRVKESKRLASAVKQFIFYTKEYKNISKKCKHNFEKYTTC